MSESGNHGRVRWDDSHLADEELAALIDGQLPVDERAAAEAHLARCRECLGEYLELKRAAGQEAPVPAEFLERAGVRPPRLTLPPRLMLRAAALLLAASALGYLFVLNRPLDLGRKPTLAKGLPAPPGLVTGKGGAAAGSPAKTDSAAKEKVAPPPSAAPPAAEAAPAVDGIRTGIRGKGADREAEARLERGQPVPEEADRMRGTETAAAAPGDGKPALQQKSLQGEPRRAETHGPVQAANQANLNVIRPPAPPPTLRFRAELTGELTVADLRNPGVLARLAALATEAEVELVVDAAGRVARIEFISPPRRAERRALCALLSELEFAPVGQGERRGRLRLRSSEAG